MIIRPLVTDSIQVLSDEARSAAEMTGKVEQGNEEIGSVLNVIKSCTKS
ncbi:MAG: hypothetical protein V3U62_06825 [Sedimenticolaceae bacterium]